MTWGNNNNNNNTNNNNRLFQDQDNPPSLMQPSSSNQYHSHPNTTYLNNNNSNGHQQHSHHHHQHHHHPYNSQSHPYNNNNINNFNDGDHSPSSQQQYHSPPPSHHHNHHQYHQSSAKPINKSTIQHHNNNNYPSPSSQESIVHNSPNSIIYNPQQQQQQQQQPTTILPSVSPNTFKFSPPSSLLFVSQLPPISSSSSSSTNNNSTSTPVPPPPSNTHNNNYSFKPIVSLSNSHFLEPKSPVIQINASPVHFNDPPFKIPVHLPSLSINSPSHISTSPDNNIYPVSSPFLKNSSSTTPSSSLSHDSNNPNIHPSSSPFIPFPNLYVHPHSPSSSTTPQRSAINNNHYHHHNSPTTTTTTTTTTSSTNTPPPPPSHHPHTTNNNNNNNPYNNSNTRNIVNNNNYNNQNFNLTFPDTPPPSSKGNISSSFGDHHYSPTTKQNNIESVLNSTTSKQQAALQQLLQSPQVSPPQFINFYSPSVQTNNNNNNNSNYISPSPPQPQCNINNNSTTTTTTTTTSTNNKSIKKENPTTISTQTSNSTKNYNSNQQLTSQLQQQQQSILNNEANSHNINIILKNSVYANDLQSLLSLPTEFNDAEFPEIKGKYKILDKIGQGTFSGVYKSVCIDGPFKGLIVALKRVAPTSSPARIINEIHSLLRVGGSHNVSALLGALRYKDQVTLILPYFEHDSFKDYFFKMTPNAFRHYLYALFTSLKHVHSHNICHRDVKPTNFLYCQKRNAFMLIDFGLAQEMPPIEDPKKKRSTRGIDDKSRQKTSTTQPQDNKPQQAPRAGTRGFRAPEVLLKYNKQTTAIDIWSVGVIILCIISGRYPFFISPDDLTSLAEIISIIGTDKIIELANMLDKRIFISHQVPYTSWKSLAMRLRNESGEEKENIPMEAYDLLERCLDLNPFTRITASEALTHPFLLPIHQQYNNNK
eukprot:gene1175-1487_t